MDQALNACPPTLELDFSSTMTGTLVTQVPPLIVTSTVNFSGEIISGFGAETCSDVSLTASLVIEDGTTCLGTLAGETPSTFTVQPGDGDQMSQVKFKFTSQYNPLLVSLGETALCDFCPLYQKTPVEVDVLVDPGTPSELVTNSCGGMTSPVNTWLALWSYDHGFEGAGGYITRWQLPGPMGVFAEKNISKAIAIPNGSGSENTTFTLVNPPPNSNQ